MVQQLYCGCWSWCVCLRPNTCCCQKSWDTAKDESWQTALDRSQLFFGFTHWDLIRLCENKISQNACHLSFQSPIPMSYQKKCECCWNTITAYSRKLSRSVVSWLVTFVIEYRDRMIKYWKPRIELMPSDVDMPLVAYQNFAYLRHFGVVHREKKWKWYHPTKLWWDFVAGFAKIPDKLYIMQQQVLPLTHECWEWEDPQRMVSLYEILDHDEYRYSQRLEEFQIEKWYRQRKNPDEWLFWPDYFTSPVVR